MVERQRLLFSVRTVAIVLVSAERKGIEIMINNALLVVALYHPKPGVCAALQETALTSAREIVRFLTSIGDPHRFRCQA